MDLKFFVAALLLYPFLKRREKKTEIKDRKKEITRQRQEETNRRIWGKRKRRRKVERGEKEQSEGERTPNKDLMQGDTNNQEHDEDGARKDKGINRGKAAASNSKSKFCCRFIAAGVWRLLQPAVLRGRHE